MKKLFLLLFMCSMALSILSQELIDLGLPSGTLWKDQNEEDYTRYGNVWEFKELPYKYSKIHVPLKGQFQELVDVCQWNWMGNGYRIVGSNGNSIFLPINDIYTIDGEYYSRKNGVQPIQGSYWSATHESSSKDAWYLCFGPDGDYQVKYCLDNYGFNVRLASDNYRYVDLGLPSGTMWENNNRAGYEPYKEAIKYGSFLPTKEQFQELIDYCKITWTKEGCMFTGPNGNSILFPFSGCHSQDDEYRRMGWWGKDSFMRYGEWGHYWCSTPSDEDEEKAWAFYVMKEYKQFGVYVNLKRGGLSIRCVKNRNDEQ